MWSATFQRAKGVLGSTGKDKKWNGGRSSLQLGLSMLVPVYMNVTSNEGKRTQEVEQQSIGVYLKPESNVLLRDYLSGRGLKDYETPFICIVRNASPQETFVYKPLYGQRAAFRLKGFLHSDVGTVGVGRVSTMVGELKEEDYEPALPLLKAESNNNLKHQRELMDLPTRRMHISGMKRDAMWKGRLPPATIRGEKHPAVSGMTFTPLPLDKQIVVEGYICSSRYVDETGRCLYEREEDKEELHAMSAAISEQAQPSPSVLTEQSAAPAAASAAGDEAKAECPVCKYMKAGPCKEEFLEWDACVQSADEESLHTKCFPTTCKMMNCMKKHEYYDIMTAGTDFSKMEKVEKESEIAVHEQTHTNRPPSEESA